MPSAQSDKKGWRYVNTVSPNDDWWKSGLYPAHLGQLFRLRGIVGMVLAQASTIGGILWAHADWKVVTAFAVPGVVVILLMVYVRFLLIAGCRADDALHELLHHSRDRLNDVFSSESRQSYLRAVKEFHAHVCQRIAVYFRERTGDPHIACCIRVMAVDESGRRQFCTVARSDGLASEREKKSEPIADNEGIVKAFLEKGCEGAFRIDDIRDAHQDGVWKITENDQRFADIKAVLVCPINGHYDGEMRMLGLLFLTSREGPIQEVFWTAQKAIADNLGLVFALLYDEKRIPVKDEQPATTEDARR